MSCDGVPAHRCAGSTERKGGVAILCGIRRTINGWSGEDGACQIELQIESGFNLYT
jgi:hypothetical protein